MLKSAGEHEAGVRRSLSEVAARRGFGKKKPGPVGPIPD
jgi:hypothetical protein